MTQSQFSLSWDAYQNNICNGLSSLQQNAEFVDMTLAADGHYVKVHQIIMALASPFIKDLISSANCPHPIIFLNRISYATLKGLLEYIYTGEVLVQVEHVTELIDAAKELHIKGLEDMNVREIASHNSSYPMKVHEEVESLDEMSYFEVHKEEENSKDCVSQTSMTDMNDDRTISMTEETLEEELPEDEVEEESNTRLTLSSNQFEGSDIKTSTIIQYTVSNQGSLQMIFNRYMYYLKHTNRNNSRQWRCVDYLNQMKCPARVITLDDRVLRRISAHKHPFHDHKILKKVRSGAVFTALQDAEAEGAAKRTLGGPRIK